MNILLWALQIVLAVKFVSVTYTHGLRPDETKMKPGAQSLGRLKGPLLILVGVCALLGAAGLVLPAATGFLPRLTPLTAAVLAGMMFLSIAFHINCREKPNILVSLVLFALAAFLAYGRWLLAPL